MTHKTRTTRRAKGKAYIQLLAALLLAAAPVAFLAVMQPADALNWPSSVRNCTQQLSDQNAGRIIQACNRVIEERGERLSVERLTQAHLARGRAHFERSNFSDASADFERVIELEPNNPQGYLELGRTLRQINDLDGALEIFAQLDERYVNHGQSSALAAALIASGEIRNEREDWAGAMAAYTRLIELGERAPIDSASLVAAYVGRGDAKLGDENIPGALTDFQAAVALDNRSVDALVALARGHRAQAFPQYGPPNLRAYDDALAQLDTADQLLPETPQTGEQRDEIVAVRVGRGELHLLRYLLSDGESLDDDLNAARHDFNEALRWNADSADALRGRAAVHLEEARRGGGQRAVRLSLSDLDRAVLLTPDDKRLYRLRGDAYWQLRDATRAMAEYDQAIQRGGASTELYMVRGEIYADQRDYRRAIQSVSRAIEAWQADIERHPNDPERAAHTVARRAEALHLRSLARLSLIDDPGEDAVDLLANARDDADAAGRLVADPRHFTLSCRVRATAGDDLHAAEHYCERAVRLAATTPSSETTEEREQRLVALREAQSQSGFLQLRWALAAARNREEQAAKLREAVSHFAAAIEADSDQMRVALNTYAQGLALECGGEAYAGQDAMRGALRLDRGVAARVEAQRVRRCGTARI
jgi:tetratricopeptide (TPR) repeat protein